MKLWTYSALAQHIRSRCQAAEHEVLQRIGKGTVCKNDLPECVGYFEAQNAQRGRGSSR